MNDASDELLCATARRVQKRLEEFYALEEGPDVGLFVQRAESGGRETLVLREHADSIEVTLVLPETAQPGTGPLTDEHLQLFEGVSHFVYLAERARVDLPVTELELELQAEVDKFVLLAFDGAALAADRAGSIRLALYENVQYLHPARSERGARYRLANDLAAKVSKRLERRHRTEARQFLQRFYRSGQTDKIRIASAA